ncbi:MAG: hypothetical protein F6K31_36580 [Symploca sp. SIO2G7]|nr:hypothetical protein [Symploca sp. SIO2G7]
MEITKEKRKMVIFLPQLRVPASPRLRVSLSPCLFIIPPTRFFAHLS